MTDKYRIFPVMLIVMACGGILGRTHGSDVLVWDLCGRCRELSDCFGFLWKCMRCKGRAHHAWHSKMYRPIAAGAGRILISFGRSKRTRRLSLCHQRLSRTSLPPTRLLSTSCHPLNMPASWETEKGEEMSCWTSPKFVRKLLRFEIHTSVIHTSTTIELR